jgi:hypothetical protein
MRLMKRAQPLALSPRRIQQLLRKTKTSGSAAGRIEALSRQFLGRPYVSNPLLGSAESGEIFTASIEAFDCVTYIETILALSRASTVDDFVNWLRLIRYRDGQVEWNRRNHYMTSWIRSNVRLGVVRRVPAPMQSVVEKSRVLNVVPGLPAAAVKFRCVPKQFLPRMKGRILTGDLVFFASTRTHCDVFHCGIVVRQRDRLLLRHASRSRNGVVEQALADFLKNNRMSGVILVRPT